MASSRCKLQSWRFHRGSVQRDLTSSSRELAKRAFHIERSVFFEDLRLLGFFLNLSKRPRVPWEEGRCWKLRGRVDAEGVEHSKTFANDLHHKLCGQDRQALLLELNNDPEPSINI